MTPRQGKPSAAVYKISTGAYFLCTLCLFHPSFQQLMSGTKPQILSKGRIESFSDGVFSIVLTLLIFNFHVPQISGPDMNGALFDRLLAMHPYCVTYVLSFILISMFWIAHHSLFHSLKHSTTPLLWLNNLFLLFLAFIPFPTQVLGSYPDLETATLFFGGAMMLTSLSFTLMRYYCYFGAKLTDDSVSDEDMRSSMTKSWVGTSFYIVAIVVSAYSPDITLSMYALIPFLFFIPITITKK